MKIFISGIAGFVGSNLADALLKLGHAVYGIDDLSGGTFENIPNDVYAWSKAKCSEHGTFGPGLDVLVHTAALPHEGLSVFSPRLITDTIYSESIALFSGAIAGGVRRIVNMSSMSRYGAIPSPFREVDEPRPRDPYGIAKLAAEATLECLCEQHGVEYVTAIPHSIYGPKQCRSDPYRNVIAIMMNRILQGKAPIIYGSGTQRRCFSYIDDVIPSLVQMVTGDNPDMLGRSINIGPDSGEVSINELCAIVSAELGYRTPPIYYDARPAEVHTANCSADLARKLFGFEAKTSLQEGIHLMAEWMKKVGPKEFNYRLPIEIVRPNTPKTWTHKEI